MRRADAAARGFLGMAQLAIVLLRLLLLSSEVLVFRAGKASSVAVVGGVSVGGGDDDVGAGAPVGG